MLELGQADKFMDEASSSSRSAEYENELILEGEELPDPEIYENLLIHWKVHVKAIQDLSFKRKTPDEIKNKMKEHIMATEMLMGQMAERNPEFGKVLLTLSQFPLFFYPETKPQIPMAGQDATLLPVEPPAPAVLPADVLPPEQMPPLPENQAPSAIQPAGEPMVGPPGVAISPSIEQ